MSAIKYCRWAEDEDGLWSTSCGQDFQFYDSGPVDNKFRFCPYCGTELTQHLYAERLESEETES